MLKTILDILSKFHTDTAEKLGSRSNHIRVEAFLVHVVIEFLVPNTHFFVLIQKL